MARLIAYGRVSSQGLLSWAPGKAVATNWADLDAGPVAEYGLPKLRAKYFFDEPFTKYGRMDPLCKIAVGAAQLAFKAADLSKLDRDEVAQVGGTMLGCLEVDAQFEATRLAGAPSPALFVYTLPSMFQGEIAIHWRLRGRCTLLSTGELSAMTALATGIRWIDKGRAKHVLVVAADAAGPAAVKLGMQAQSAAAAWLLDAGQGLGDAQYNQPAGNAAKLSPGKLGHACTFVDVLEARLLSGEPGRVFAEAGGQSVSFKIG